jgi:hypothetical protein
MNEKEPSSSQPEKQDAFPAFLRCYERLLWIQIILLFVIFMGTIFFHTSHIRILNAAMALIFVSILLLVYLRFINPAKN